jgi:HK97 gp10 family phage protein
MARFTVQLEGQQQFAGALRIWEREKRRELAGVVKAAAGDIAADAKSRAPRRSGKLADSIEPDTTRTDTDLYAEVKSKVFYARMVEQGTSRAKAVPFLHPAFEANARRLFDEMRQILSR